MAEQPTRAAHLPRSRRVVVGVSGSIAAYKAPFVIRALRAQGHEVKVVPTEAALRFIGAPTLAAISGRPVATGVFDDPAAVEHVAIAEWAELVLVAPASADLLARVTAGRSDDLLTATILTASAPVVLAPAMHTQMWEAAVTRENVATLRRRGLVVIEPDTGRLTGADSGKGRFPEPERVVAQALASLEQHDCRQAVAAADPREVLGQGGVLAGRTVLVSAGGTREPLDPVRYLGNRSTGRQGCAIAAAVTQAGGKAILVAANIESEVLTSLPATVRVVPVGTARELEAAVHREGASADAVVMTAAVADFRPAQASSTKLKKHPLGADDQAAEPLRLELVENPDILAGLVRNPLHPGQIVVGFAAETGDETGDVLAHGVAKARRKGADLLAVNAVGEHLGFGDVPNAVVVLDRQGQEVARTSGTKADVARLLVELLAQRLSS
ncbi:DNA/pantothenate metabolism flavoprotein [Actinomyces bovis]|uniref:Coenzyme A biosynthesis bifunctional protein CoaBC n=1 Tax=Actinomyces bovis TaxID=1658 RepID=A0ABY1VPI9_9ACTO|nr:bifunctional phosphopantothenoylcysteine decarboxylase/phosphopantothenate--cysteine ligase CoaBC [Actinomyces bovis]SPT54041.1 DNA/pantothenate metabolism flavoprotein [Actinomyces bovis]VEG53797.1 DNA/pantothenate metabolism flavoprotein [Actinomyces israelii]